MHARYALAFGIVFLAVSPSIVAAQELRQVCTKQSFDDRVDSFFARIMRGETLPALTETLGQTPMMQGRDSDLSTLARQIQTATDIYGPMNGFECVREERFGSNVVRRQYVAQHEKMLTRWTLMFIRLKSGWWFHQVSYEDQVSTWLD